MELLKRVCHLFPFFCNLCILLSILTCNALNLRRAASSFAKKAAATQLAAFRRWGVMADWQTNCYYTYDKQYEVNQLEVFYKMYEKVRSALNYNTDLRVVQ